MTKARTLADNFAADISGVTAGTGITGGGTSGTVTITNSMATAIDAKGDLLVGTGADTFSRLAVASTAGYLLSVDSAESTGLKWAAPAASGGYTELASGTFPNNSNVVSITGISGSYRDLVIVIKQLVFASTSSNLQIRFNEDGNASRHATNTTFGDTAPGNFNSTAWTVSREQNTGAGNNKSLIVATFLDYANTTTWKIGQGYGLTVNDTDATQYKFRNSMGFYNQTGALSSFTLISSTGDFTSGSYTIYGVK